MDDSPWRARMHPPPDITYQQGNPGFLQQGMPVDGALIGAWLEGLDAMDCAGEGRDDEGVAAFERALQRLPGPERGLLEGLRRVGLLRVAQLPMQVGL